jgi:hypothetical protein
MRIERLGQSGGHCDCCGNESRRVWGLVYEDEVATAAYWMHWTVGRLSDHGANLDLVIGPWGDNALADQRVAVSLRHRELSGEAPALMVIDAAGRPSAALAGNALMRADVVGTPLAETVFGLVDAIYQQDGRFFA